MAENKEMQHLTQIVAIEKDTKMVEVNTRCSKILQRALGLQVFDPESLGFAVEGLKIIKLLKTDVESKRKFFVGPLNDQVTKINKLFKIRYSDILTNAKEVLEGKVLKHQADEREKYEEQLRLQKEEGDRIEKKLREEEEKKRLEEDEREAENLVKEEDETLRVDVEHEKEKLEEEGFLARPEEIYDTPLFKPETTIKQEGVTISTKGRRTFEVVDIRLVPIKYLMVVNKTVMDDVYAGVDYIPGLRIFKKEGLATRTGKAKEIDW